MTLPIAWNIISMGMVATEFGGSGLLRLSDYYAGGGRVPGGTIGHPNRQPTPIPSGGTISLGNFHGASKRVFVFMGDSGTLDTSGFSRFEGYLVGGGGGGGNGSDNPRHGAGGGGGGARVRYINTAIPESSYYIEIGEGGRGDRFGSPWDSSAYMRDGLPTRAFNYSSASGGGGGGYTWGWGDDGSRTSASGGGGACTRGTAGKGALGIVGNGHDGADAVADRVGGGGGGAGGHAIDQNGGAGVVLSFPEVGWYREVGGGGGGAAWSGAYGLATHGGARGGGPYEDGPHAGWATGGGGGGAGEGALGGNGGSGLLVGWLS